MIPVDLADYYLWVLSSCSRAAIRQKEATRQRRNETPCCPHRLVRPCQRPLPVLLLRCSDAGHKYR